GFQGMIVAEGFTADDPDGNANFPPFGGKAPPWTTDAGNGQLSFLEGFYANAAHTYPTTPDGSQYPNPYAAGTFLFRDPVRVQTSPSGGTYTVTVEGKFDVKDGNDFGVQPFSTISGTITGQARNNGQLAPTPTPQSGVTVHLIQDGVVVGSTTTGNGGGYTFSGLRPGTYNVEQVGPADYRQVTPLIPVQFQPRTVPLPRGGEGQGVAVADFDGDGRPDVAVFGTGGGASNTVWVYYDGEFDKPPDVLSAGGSEQLTP